MAEKKSVSVHVYNIAGEEVSKINLDGSVFAIEPNEQVMFDAVQVDQSNRRQATAKTKVRHEVSGGGKKPWRQKGTGRARAGSSRSPVWVGGGTVFGPVGTQNFKLSQNKKEHQLALKSALSQVVKAKALKLVDEIKFQDNKTKNFVGMLKNLKAENKALVIINECDVNVCRSAGNVASAKLVTSSNVSVLDLLNVDTVIASVDAIKTIEEALK